jgi:hypothetical protein
VTEQNHGLGTRRLCIVSSNPILSAELVAAIQTALQPHDEIEIIRDRRRDPSSRPPGSEAPARPAVERRRQNHVDYLVKTEGFAIVPVRSPAAPIEHSDPGPSPAALPSIERPSIERPSPDDNDADQREFERLLEFKHRQEARRREARNKPQDVRAESQDVRAERQDVRAERQGARAERPDTRQNRSSVDDSDDDRREVEHILDLQRRQEVRIGSWLVLTVVLAATLIVVVQLPPVKDFLNRTRPATATEQSEQAATPRPAPSPPAATPQVATPPAATPPTATPPKAAQEPSATAESPAPAPSTPRVEAPPAPRPAPPASRPVPPSVQSRPVERQEAQARPAELPPAALPREVAALPRPTAPSPSFSEVRSQSTARSVTSAQFPGLPRVEVVRDTSEGRGAAYAVRISDTAGRPLSGAEVMLLARMSDGSVENITLGSGAEPGSYHGALPGQSTPVDLRVRVITNDKRVEIPLKP